MPIYEYRCEECEKEMEMIQKVSDNPIEVCPFCQSNSLQKRTSMSAFHLKGGGWYKDGYSTKGKEQEKTETKESADTAGKSVEKGKEKQKTPEKKPAASTSPKTSKAS